MPTSEPMCNKCRFPRELAAESPKLTLSLFQVTTTRLSEGFTATQILTVTRHLFSEGQ